jgi:hypothetical protein
MAAFLFHHSSAAFGTMPAVMRAGVLYYQQPWEEFQVPKSWDEMTDQDQSDDINRSMEHLAKYCGQRNIPFSIRSKASAPVQPRALIRAKANLVHSSVASDCDSVALIISTVIAAAPFADGIDPQTSACKKICRCQQVAGRHGGAGSGSHLG